MLIASSFDGTGLSYGNDSQENLRNLFSNFDYKGRLNKVLICDNAIIPTDTNETLAVGREIIRHGILNDGYEILKNYQRYAPIKDGREKFARILIQKKK